MAAEVAAERAARAARLVTSGSSGSGSPGTAEAFASRPPAQTATEHSGRSQARPLGCTARASAPAASKEVFACRRAVSIAIWQDRQEHAFCVLCDAGKQCWSHSLIRNAGVKQVASPAPASLASCEQRAGVGSPHVPFCTHVCCADKRMHVPG